MSGFYKPHRNPNWNYGGGRWRLSRSKIDLFKSCPRCFYIDNKLGTARPPGFPFNLNSAVDHLLKKEFDIYRAKGNPHPLMDTYSIDAVPFQHKNMDTWRENFEGVQCLHEPTGFTVMGAVDDIWVTPEGVLLIVDYKATSKDETPTLNAEWQIGYKRQMEVYQWLLRRNGFEVSNTGYFVYANGRRDVEAFDGKLEFEVIILPYTGSDSWVEETLLAIKKCLEGDEIPKASMDCDYCTYRRAVEESAGSHESHSKKESGVTSQPSSKQVPQKTDNKPNGRLF